MKNLTTKLSQLTARRDELAEELDDEPAMADPAELAHITTHIDEIISGDNPALTKALIEALVAEV